MEVDSQVVAVATASTDVIFKEVAHGFLLKYLSISKQPETPNQRSFLSWGECPLLADSRLLGTLHQRGFLCPRNGNSALGSRRSELHPLPTLPGIASIRSLQSKGHPEGWTVHVAAIEVEKLGRICCH